MLVIHDQTCPALCQLCDCALTGPLCEHARDFNCHANHACTCTAQADLAELVAASEAEIALHAEHELSHRHRVTIDNLDAALKPFRDEKPK